MTRREHEVDRLRRARPRDRFVRASLSVAAAAGAGAWFVGGFDLGELLSARRVENTARFLGDLVPFDLRGRSATLGDWLDWYATQLGERGLDAIGTTLAMSIASIVLAAIAGVGFTALATRSLATPEPYLPGGRPPGRMRRLGWSLVVAATRLVMTFLRAIPEYVWAFLLVVILGPGAWPAVFALALHNAGILGRLGAEVFENAPSGGPAALRALGASRAQIAAGALFPISLNRLLLFFFYRWETCVREATVLGMLGIVSLGYWIQQSRAANRYDEMVFFVGLGIVIVLVGDVVSTVARGQVRRAR